MDCERFDQVVIDALYDELDELTLAAAKRHTDGCTRCQAAWSGLKATHKVGVLPLVEPPDDLEERILKAAHDAQRDVPWPRRIGRAISWAGSYAMRPQTAMAALLLLMLGSSLLFLRTKPDRGGSPSRVSVTERGVPEHPGDDIVAVPERLPTTDTRAAAQAHGARKDEEKAKTIDSYGGSAPAPAAAQPPPAPAATAAPAAAGDEDKGGLALDDRAQAFGKEKSARAIDGIANAAPPAGAGQAANGPADLAQAGEQQAPDAYASAMALYSAGRFAEAASAFDAVAASGARNAPSAALYGAKSVQASSGCGQAVGKYESVAAQFAGSGAAGDALWAAAACYKALGNFDRARDTYLALRNVAGFRDRAEGEIANLSSAQQQQQLAAPSKAGRKYAAPAAGKPAANQQSPAKKKSSDSNSAF